jgi:flagellar hook-associated protein 1 FlgK
MSVILGILETAKSALFATQRALSVTGQNVANVNTPGYSRQTVVLTTATPQDGQPGQIGTGVLVAEIRRSIDRFVEGQLLGSRARLGQFEASRQALFRTQEVVNESQGVGIGSGLNEFFSALQDVATNPADLTARSILLSKAQTLAGRFNHAAATLIEQRQALNQQIGRTIEEINRLTAQIAELNTAISEALARGQQPNELQDQRGRLLADLAERIAISTIEDATGQVTVFFGGGQPLVAPQSRRALVAVASSQNGGLFEIGYDTGGAQPIVVTSLIDGGRLKGLLDARDGTIPDLLTSLDALANALVTEVNSRHRAGYGLDGSTGRDFFVAAGNTARTIAVALTDGRSIAASESATGLPGNNANALALVALQHQRLASLNDLTFTDYVSATSAKVGTMVQAADQNGAAQAVLHQQIEGYRAEVSGVSLDEELIDMLRYQRAFEAASKLIVAADDMLATLLSIKP